MGSMETTKQAPMSGRKAQAARRLHVLLAPFHERRGTRRARVVGPLHGDQRHDDLADALGGRDELAETGQCPLHRGVLIVLVTEAAQQPAADARNLRRIQWQILRLRHAHGDFWEDW